MTDLEKFHRMNSFPGFTFESTLAANSTAYGVGILRGPGGEHANIIFQNGAAGAIVSGDLKIFYDRYQEQMAAALK